MPPVIDMEKCSGCGICDKHCPLDVIYMVKAEVVKHHPERL